MADQEKGGTSPPGEQGARFGANPATPSTLGSSASVGSGNGGGASMGGAAPDAAQGTREGIEKTVNQAKHSAQDMADRAKEQGRSLFEQQKNSASQQLDSVAGAFHSTAGHLREEGQPQASQYVEIVAHRLEQFGRQLREKDVGTLIGDAEEIGRRAPGAFFAGSVVAGFLLARFLKSSAQHRHETENRPGDAAAESTAAASSAPASGWSDTSVPGTGSRMGADFTGSASASSFRDDIFPPDPGINNPVASGGSSALPSAGVELPPQGGPSHGNR